MRCVWDDTRVERYHRNYMDSAMTISEFAKAVGVSPRMMSKEFKRMGLKTKKGGTAGLPPRHKRKPLFG